MSCHCDAYSELLDDVVIVASTYVRIEAFNDSVAPQSSLFMYWVSVS